MIDDKYDGGTDQDCLLFVVNCESLGYSSHNLADSFIRLRHKDKDLVKDGVLRMILLTWSRTGGLRRIEGTTSLGRGGWVEFDLVMIVMVMITIMSRMIVVMLKSRTEFHRFFKVSLSCTIVSLSGM